MCCNGLDTGQDKLEGGADRTGRRQKGRSSSTVTVYKSGEGKGPVFRKSLPEFVYPQTGAPVTDYDEATFQRIYLTTLANRIARIFYPYDPTTDVAIDAAISSVGSF